MRPGNSSRSKSIKGKKFIRTGERQRSATEAPDRTAVDPESVSKATEQEQQRSGSFPYGWLISLMRLAKTTFKSGEQKPEQGRRRHLFLFHQGVLVSLASSGKGTVQFQIFKCMISVTTPPPPKNL